MNIEELASFVELIESLERVLDLIERVKTGHDFLHSDEVLQRLQWTAKNIADDLWSKQLLASKS
jgi:hypothetical protein